MAASDTPNWKSKNQAQTASVANASSSLFSHSPQKHFEQVQRHNLIKDAAGRVSNAIMKIFELCHKLNPKFKTEGGEVTVEDGVLDAMGQETVKLLNMEKAAPELTSTPSFGMSGHNTGNDQE